MKDTNAYSRLLHTHESSVVVPIAKRALMGMFKGMFKERGYEVLVLDFTHPEKSDAGYDPLCYVKSEQDALRLARSFVYATPAIGRVREEDPYWNNSATLVIDKATAFDNFMNAEEAIAFGIVDNIKTVI